MEARFFRVDLIDKGNDYMVKDGKLVPYDCTDKPHQYRSHHRLLEAELPDGATLIGIAGKDEEDTPKYLWYAVPGLTKTK